MEADDELNPEEVQRTEEQVTGADRKAKEQTRTRSKKEERAPDAEDVESVHSEDLMQDYE